MQRHGECRLANFDAKKCVACDVLMVVMNGKGSAIFK